MLHFNRKIYLIPNWPFHLWFGNHVVSFRLIKAKISLVMKGCFKLRALLYLFQIMSEGFFFLHLNICLIQITKQKSFSSNFRGAKLNISITNVSSVWTRKIKRLLLLNFLWNTFFFGCTCSYNQLLYFWSLWILCSELKQKVQSGFAYSISKITEFLLINYDLSYFQMMLI